MRTVSEPRLCRDGLTHMIPRPRTHDESVTKFWEMVNKTDTCWIWLGGTCGSFGYGRFWDGKREVRAHVFSFQLHIGPVPPGECVLHKCDFPLCVRPDHLFTGTRGVNNKDACAKGRNAHGERSSSAKLNAAQVLEIRAAYSQGGVSQRELASRYHVAPGCIQNILERRTWKHLS
jgi:hypothetical protein